ncbi:MAG: prolipoprotein diacylglyceryl transferase [Deltaproteobacteria bacterium]|nr:prolipoprotein diacylglyceryl transferase [Deltaproteobacteria bacterium]
MHPVLFEIPLFGGLRIYTYGVLVALGFLVGMWYVSREAKRLGQSPAEATDLVFYLIIAAILGSRLMYVIVEEWQAFLDRPWIFFRLWEGGLVFHGGLIAAVAVAVGYTRYKRRSFWTYADLFAPAIALGHGIGRIGCLAAGCCHGRQAAGAHWWTLVFPKTPYGFAPPDVPLYPTQPMESLGAFTLFVILFCLRRRLAGNGRLFAVYLFGYSCLRLLVEPLRGVAARNFILGDLVTTGQIISILLLLAAAAIWIARGRRGHV